jgi:hypothetical protein
LLWELGKTISLQLATDMLALRAAAPKAGWELGRAGPGEDFLARDKPSQSAILSSSLGPCSLSQEVLWQGSSLVPHIMRKGFTPQERCHAAATLTSHHRLHIPHLGDAMLTLKPRESMLFLENPLSPMNFLLLGSSDFVARRIPSRSPNNETVTGNLCPCHC